MAVVMGLGIWFSRQQHTNEEYFLGGRHMHWIPVGLSLFATTFSSNSFVGLPRAAAFGDYHLLLGTFFIPLVVVPLVCLYVIPFYRRLGLSSVYQYLEWRFSRRVRLFASAVFMVYTAGWMGNMLVAVGKILQVVLDTTDNQVYFILIAVGLFATVYTVMGGVKAVIWTDTLQAFALGGGMVFLLVIIVGKIDGGWDRMIQEGVAANKFEMFRTSGGFKVPNFFAACAFGFFVYMGGQVASYTAVQRYLTVSSISDARRALIVKGVFTPIACTLFFVVGTSLYVFYQQSAPEVFDSLSGKTEDQLLPHFAMNYAGRVGIVGLLLAGLFAAAMSSLDSGINSMTASLVTDWLGGKEVGPGRNRIFTLIFGVSAIALACLIQTIDMPVFSILMSISGGSLGVLLAVMLLGMLIERSNALSATCAFVFGISGFVLARCLHVHNFWDGAFSCVFALVAGLVSMYLAPAPKTKQLKGLMLFGRFKPPAHPKDEE